jgi:hypothetical protein
MDPRGSSLEISCCSPAATKRGSTTSHSQPGCGWPGPAPLWSFHTNLPFRPSARLYWRQGSPRCCDLVQTDPGPIASSARCARETERDESLRLANTARAVAPLFAASWRSAAACRFWHGNSGTAPPEIAYRSGRGSDGRRSKAGGACRTVGRRCRRPPAF